MILVVAFAEPRKRRPLILWSIGTYLLIFLIEAAGVATGSIFGVYSYGATPGIQIWEVPLVIGFNWVLVVAAATIVSERVTPHPVVGALLAGALTVIFDWVLEPVAMRLDYWSWKDDVIPLRNYIAWFVVATLTSLVWRLLGLQLRRWLLPTYAGIQLVFFLVLRWRL